MITGICAVSSAAFSAAQTAKPSMSGIITSSITMSGCSLRAMLQRLRRRSRRRRHRSRPRRAWHAAGAGWLPRRRQPALDPTFRALSLRSVIRPAEPRLDLRQNVLTNRLTALAGRGGRQPNEAGTGDRYRTGGADLARGRARAARRPSSAASGLASGRPAATARPSPEFLGFVLDLSCSAPTRPCSPSPPRPASRPEDIRPCPRGARRRHAALDLIAGATPHPAAASGLARRHAVSLGDDAREHPAPPDPRPPLRQGWHALRLSRDLESVGARLHRRDQRRRSRSRPSSRGGAWLRHRRRPVRARRAR